MDVSDGTISQNPMKKEVKNPIDFMLAQAQLETDIAKEIVEKIKSQKPKEQKEKSDNYYDEKMALKMLEFFKQEEKVITLYTEAKENYPLMAELMENKRPYLKQLLEEAKHLYEKSLLE